jgi:hypothetical protein
MSFLQRRIDVAARIAASFTALPVESNPAEEWSVPAAGAVVVHFEGGKETQRSSPGGGTALHLAPFVATVEIYTPAGAGDGLALSYAEQIAALFWGWGNGSLITQDVEQATVGKVGAHWVEVLYITFESEANRTLAS